MKLVAEYLERAVQFRRMGESENNLTIQAQMREQAEAYYKLAVKCARESSQPIPAKPWSKADV
jgi:hypothetical protein